ncbi:conserved hypothetical protein [Desulfamplus magnetovallimortis]|uniref:HD/PDEase domain-containing protein n=1 Tax=Desulfamplus magnetovallimortis TaxID=1246637 RepID=A0A1W1HBE3_9BACT|nr:HD domain-containing protein [Desulfamplus magnetovallimortis]SLM29715.1 conserved hypothetical protein [Desulfamplus magnetovallimortis]
MKCPGQETQYWNKDAIFDSKCPECGAAIEFFKDDTSRRCSICGKRIVNPKMDFGCASYCQFAEQCIGTLPEEFLKQREDLLKDRVAVEMKRYFKTDFRRIGHATRVARYAEDIGKAEMGKLTLIAKEEPEKPSVIEKEAPENPSVIKEPENPSVIGKSDHGNLSVILCAAYLHDIGIKEAERKYNSNAPKYQELEGPPIAKEILEKLGAKEEIVSEVCDIVGHHHHPRENETLNFKVLYDADLITNLEEEKKAKAEREELKTKYGQQENTLPDNERIRRIIEKSFLTQSGRQKANKILL